MGNTVKKISILFSCLFLVNCAAIDAIKGATPIGAATSIADAAAEQTEAEIQENIANSELDIAEKKVQASKLIFDAFKSCVSEFQVDLQIDRQRACSACAERYDVDKAVCLAKKL